MSKKQEQIPAQAGLLNNSQREFLREALSMVLKARLKPDMKPFQWAKTLLAMHTRGFLYFVPGKEKPIDLLIGGFQIKNKSQSSLRSVPEEEEGKKGDYFYCPFYLPADAKLPFGPVRRFFKNSGIKSIVFEDDNDQLKEYKFKRRK